MEGHFLEIVTDQKIQDVARKLTCDEVLNIQQVCYRFDDEEDGVRKFDTYYVSTPKSEFVMKQVDAQELFNYTHYLENTDLPVPKLLGHIQTDERWILIEKIDGPDLAEMTDELAVSAAISLSRIQNTFWQKSGDTERFNAYWKRILKRAQYVAEDELLRSAYQKFLDRQLECPRTLSLGDCLPENLISRNGTVFLIDWGFGGIMPYSLDVARLIAHGSEERKPFPYFITEGQKKLFLDTLYAHLTIKPEKNVFLNDVRLALLNEYVEFMEADEDMDGWYALHAKQVAQEILQDCENKTK